MDGFFDVPAGYRDADIEMAELESAGREGSRLKRLSNQLVAEGNLMAAANACPHWSRYGLSGTAARDAGDPRYGEKGDRCTDCGSWVSDALEDWREGLEPQVYAACEFRPVQ